MKYTVNISQDVGSHQQANIFLSDVLAIVFKKLEQKGFKFPLSKVEEITPEILEKIILGERTNNDEDFHYSKNKAINSFLMEIEETGGIDKETAECIRLSSKEFRDSFEFKHDQI